MQSSSTRPRWRRGLFTGRRSERGIAAERQRSSLSLALHQLGRASAHASAGVIVLTAVLLWTVVGVAVAFPAWWENSLYIVSSAVTLVMLFALQHTQSRQTTALQLKLDEILRALPTADDRLVALEEAPDQELQQLADLSLEHRTEAQEAAEN